MNDPQLNNLQELLSYNDVYIQTIKSDLQEITNASKEHNAFVQMMKEYVNTEILVKCQLDQLDHFLISTDNLSTESTNLTALYAETQNIISEYKSVVENNNLTTSNVQSEYAHTKERIQRLKAISENIMGMLGNTESFSFKNRKQYTDTIISTQIIKPLIIQIPSDTFLTINTREFILSEYFVEPVENALTYELGNNLYNNAKIERNNENKWSLKIKGNYRGIKYNIVVKAINSLHPTTQSFDVDINDPNNPLIETINYSFLTFNVEEDYSPPVQRQDLLNQNIIIRNAPITLNIDQYFDYVDDNTTYMIDDDVDNITSLTGKLLTLTGRQSDTSRTIQIIAKDNRDRASSPLLLTYLDLPADIAVLQAFPDNITCDTDQTFNLDTYFDHPTLDLEYQLFISSIPDFTHFKIVDNIMSVDKRFRNISYSCTLIVRTKQANTINSQTSFLFTTTETQSIPIIKQTPNPNYIWIDNKIVVNTVNASNISIILTNVFESTGTMQFNVAPIDSVHSTFFSFIDGTSPLLTLKPRYRNITYDIKITAYTAAGSIDLTITVNESEIPYPIVSNQFSTLYSVNPYYDTYTSIQLSNHFNGFSYDYSQNITLPLTYEVEVYYFDQITSEKIIINDANDIRASIFNGYLIIHPKYNNMEINIKVIASNITYSGVNQSVESVLVFHEDVKDVVIKQNFTQTSILTNELITYTLSNYFDGDNLQYTCTPLDGVTIENGLLKIQSNYRNKTYDVFVTATSNHFSNGTSKTAQSKIIVREDIMRVNLVNDANALINIDVGLNTISLNQFFTGANIVYSKNVYKNASLTETFLINDSELYIQGSNLYVNGAYRNMKFYVKVTASNTNYMQQTFSKSSVLTINEALEPVSLKSVNFIDVYIDDLVEFFQLDDYFNGGEIVYTFSSTSTFNNIDLTTNSLGRVCIKISGNYRNTIYNVYVTATNSENSAVFTLNVNESQLPESYVPPTNVIDYNTLNNVVTLADTNKLIMLDEFFRFYDSFLVGVFDTIQNWNTVSDDDFMVKYGVIVINDIVSIQGEYLDKTYYVVIRLKSASGNVLNKVITVTELIDPPLIIQDLSDLDLGLLEDQQVYINLSEYFIGSGLSYTFESYIINNVGDEIITDLGVVINVDSLVLNPSFRNIEYFVKVTASNTSHNFIQNKVESTLSVRENLSNDSIVVQDMVSNNMLTIEPVTYILDDYFSPLPTDFSYEILDANNIVDPSPNANIKIYYDVNIAKWCLTIYPNYRNKAYNINVIASYPNFSQQDNDRFEIINVRETIRPVTVEKELGSVVIKTAKTWNLLDYFSGPNIIFEFTSISYNVSLVDNNLYVSPSSPGNEYDIVVRAYNIDYLNNATAIAQSTMRVIEISSDVQVVVEGAGSDPIVLADNISFNTIILGNNTEIVNISNCFTGGERTYSYTVKDANGVIINGLDISLFKLQESTYLSITGAYRNTQYNIDVIATNTENPNNMVSFILYIEELIQLPKKINGGLESKSILFLTDNIVQYDLNQYFSGYTSLALTINGQIPSNNDNAYISNDKLYIIGNYRNTEYSIRVTAFSSPTRFIFSDITVVENIKPPRLL